LNDRMFMHGDDRVPEIRENEFRHERRACVAADIADDVASE